VQPAQSASDIRLVVIVVVDQMRFDYLDRYADFWTSGLKRIRSDAAIFERGFYPYLNTVTCAGHATIATGTMPSTHGIIMNEWWQRAAGRRMSCTDDPAIVSLPYGGGADTIGHSAHRLRVPTLADRLRARDGGARVVSLSMKPRSSVMLAGHGGTAVTWFADSNVWSTSSAFAPQPVPDVRAYVAAHPVDADRREVWERVHEVSRYQGRDETLFERPRPAWSSAFPHPLAGAAGTQASEFYNLWERSPYSDRYLAGMAASLIRTQRLGQRDAVDFLGVSFSGLDYVGHDFGPDSHEVQDTLVRLDRSLGELLDALDRSVGGNRYVLGLSADHGVAAIPEQRRAVGDDAGRVTNAQVRKVAEAAMIAAHGPGPHIAHVEYTNVYLTDATRARVAASPSALRPLIDAVSRMDGILRVFASAPLEYKRTSADPLERAAALSHFPGESGDAVVALKPNWIGTDTSTTTHGSHHPYDQHVPVILMGPRIAPGRYAAPASPADIAPTLASMVGLPMPGVDGRVLKEAVK
jgi:predicted AlkP superfamily pyrophosphatase or phosphodiesterase